MRRETPCAAGLSYLDRQPERLVVEGYRHWMAGYESGSIEPWETAWSYYTAELGAADGRRAVSDLSAFVRTLRGCAGCPLRIFPSGARHLCREECLAVGLVAACQHGDLDLEGCCISALAGCHRGIEIADAAGRYASTLKEIGQTLMPVPAQVLSDIVARSNQARFH
ncbi:hypothetical protein [Amorphus sp. 3PC139-8]|uniref:hypothetical protein n=1 Tax=Amorphus sp. 3PC139-8 TaxID=2735676 RepID=UPI00345CAEE3